jgi:hypothetical protein
MSGTSGRSTCLVTESGSTGTGLALTNSTDTDVLVAWNPVLRKNTPDEQTVYYGDNEHHQDDVQDEHDALPGKGRRANAQPNFGLPRFSGSVSSTTGSQPPVQSLIHPCARRVYSAGAA